MPTQITFTYTDEQLASIQKSLSPERLRGYKARTGDDLAKALELYLWNMAVSETLYGALQTFEVTLRNSMNEQLCAKYGAEWFKMRAALFKDSQVLKIDRTLSRIEGTVTVSRVVADLSFSFWADLINHEIYDKLWRQCIFNAFPNRPKGTKRNTAANPITRLNTLRNRIAHHEPIWDRNLQRDYDIIIDMLNWICPLTSNWVKDHCDFPSVLAKRPI